MKTEIPTNYKIVCRGRGTFEGNCEIPKSVWEYASNEFPADPDLPAIGVCENPVVSKILEDLEIKEEVMFYDIYPIRKPDQILYLGWEVED